MAAGHAYNSELILVNGVIPIKRIWRRLLARYYASQLPLGLNNEIVEIEESRFHRKYDKGISTSEGWIFGMIERGGGQAMYFHVPNKKADTLMPSITKYVSVNAEAVCTDCFFSIAGSRRQVTTTIITNVTS